MRLALNLPHIQLPPWAYRVYDFLARWVPPVLRWTSLIFLCLFIGLTVAVMGMFGAIFWCGIAAMLLLPLVVTQQNRLLREGTVYVYLGYIVLLPMAVKMTFEGLQSPPQILLFTLGLLGLPAFLRYCGQSRLLVLAMLSFLLFITFALLSTYFGRSQTMAFINQSFSDLKGILMLCGGFLALWTARTERILDRFARYYWLFAGAMVALEWGAPSAYYKVFHGMPGGPDPTGIFPGRANGPYEHPAYLAATATFFGIYCFARMVTEKNWRGWAVAAAGHALILLFAVQRQALIGAMAACFMIMLLSNPRALVKRGTMALMGGALILSVVGSIYSKYIVNDLQQWGNTRTGAVTAPRAQIYQTSVEIAQNYFPLGAGLGTYGGAGAAKYDDTLYWDSGFNQLWWFQRKENFLMDTYWPNPIAETGMFGAASLMSFYLFMLAFMVVKAYKARPGLRFYWLLASGSFLSVLQLTATHPGFTDPRLFLLTSMTLGWAATREREAKAVTAVGPQPQKPARFGMRSAYAAARVTR